MDSVLFVDGDRAALQELEQLVQPAHSLWDMTFSRSPKTMLASMDGGKRFDVVVTDLELPEMNGVSFLGEVKTLLPQAVRMVLTASTDARLLARASSVSHQFLRKPCDAHTLRVLVSRALRVREHLGDSPLKQRLHETGALPSLPVVYQEVVRQMSDPDCSVAEIGKTIEKDAALSAKLLQVVNSAGVGLRQEVTSVVHAAALLGLDRLSAIVLAAEVFSAAQMKSMPRGFSLDALWQHSLKVGEYAKRIAACQLDEAKTIEESFTSGLLHDIGLIVLATAMPEELSKALARAKQEGISLFEAEKKVFAATHAQVGGYLLELWGLPDPIAEAIAFHDFPSGLPEESYPSNVPTHGFTALTAVHVANYFCEDETSAAQGQAPAEIDTFFMERLGFQERLEAWWDACHVAGG